jgi:SOS response regulatory protein OraA/RecX
MDAITEEGYFRPRAYAAARTRQLLKRGLGSSLVKARLRGEGIEISKEDIGQAFEQIGTQPLDELRTLLQKTQRRWERRSDLTPKQKRDRIIQSLARKGHSISDILKLLKEE